MMFSFSGSRIRKDTLSIDVLSQSLEWTCPYFFKPCAKRQRQARSHVRGLLLRLLLSGSGCSFIPRAEVGLTCIIERPKYVIPPALSEVEGTGGTAVLVVPEWRNRSSISDLKAYWAFFAGAWAAFCCRIFTSQFVPDLPGPPVPAAASALPANYPVSPPAAHSSPCTSVRIPYACSTTDAAVPPCIPAAGFPDIPVAVNTSAPARSRKCTGSANPPGTSNRALSPWPRCAETR